MAEETPNPQSPEAGKSEPAAAAPAAKPAPVAAAVATAPKPVAPKAPALPPWPHDEKVLCYPNMILWELVIMMGTVVFIWAWSLFMNAPLEEMANPNLTPNPSRAPWYFLGLQELLVYFDPWIAGVILPQFIVQGLILLPFVDTNPRQQGYYSYKGRQVEFWVMTIGFLMWFILILIGSTCRGPSWQWFWPWESWLNPKPAAPPTWNISDLGGPKVGLLIGLGTIGGYFAIGFILPIIFFRKWVEEKGIIKYTLIMVHLLVMAGVPIKICLRLLLNVKYVLHLVTPIGSINI